MTRTPFHDVAVDNICLVLFFPKDGVNVGGYMLFPWAGVCMEEHCTFNFPIIFLFFQGFCFWTWKDMFITCQQAFKCI